MSCKSNLVFHPKSDIIWLCRENQLYIKILIHFFLFHWSIFIFHSCIELVCLHHLGFKHLVLKCFLFSPDEILMQPQNFHISEATPKALHTAMNLDGLTLRMVKSHLQVYFCLFSVHSAEKKLLFVMKF